MEDSAFDELTRKLASPVSRRTVFRAAMASVAGGIGVMASLGRAKAASQSPNACHGAGTPCHPSGQNNECCTGYCLDIGGNDRCGCPNGSPPCVTTVGCPAGFSSCEVCPQVCTGGAVLNSGTCTCQCSGGAQFCGGRCVPACAGGEVLDQSTCKCTCPGGTEFCNAQAACVPACSGGQALNQTTCACGCPVGTITCTPSGGGSTICCPPDQDCSDGICCPNEQVNVKGSCCPADSVCTDTNGAQICCGTGLVCDTTTMACVSFCLI